MTDIDSAVERDMELLASIRRKLVFHHALSAHEFAALARAEEALKAIDHEKARADEAERERDGFRQQYFDSCAAVDRMEDRAVEAETALHSPRTEVMHAAWALCDDTEGTVFQDEFGEHYRVPKDSWDRLSKALDSADPSEPTIIQKLRAELVEAVAPTEELTRLRAIEAAVQPLVNIANAYDANELDDEGRKYWGLNYEHQTDRDPADVELYSGRGGRRLLTLADCLKAREALAVKPAGGADD